MITGRLVETSWVGWHRNSEQVVIVAINDGTAPVSLFVDWDSVDGATFEVQWFSDAPLTVMAVAPRRLKAILKPPALSVTSNIGCACELSAPDNKAPGPIKPPEWQIFD